jgi:hypothetical protein
MVPMLQCGLVRSNLALAIAQTFFSLNVDCWEDGTIRYRARKSGAAPSRIETIRQASP